MVFDTNIWTLDNNWNTNLWNYRCLSRKKCDTVELVHPPKKNKGHYFVDRSGFLFRFLDLRNLCHSIGGIIVLIWLLCKLGYLPPKKLWKMDHQLNFEPVGNFIFFLGQFLGTNRIVADWKLLIDQLLNSFWHRRNGETAMGEIPCIHQRGKFLMDKNLVQLRGTNLMRT